MRPKCARPQNNGRVLKEAGQALPAHGRVDFDQGRPRDIGCPTDVRQRPRPISVFVKASAEHRHTQTMFLHRCCDCRAPAILNEGLLFGTPLKNGTNEESKTCTRTSQEHQPAAFRELLCTTGNLSSIWQIRCKLDICRITLLVNEARRHQQHCPDRNLKCMGIDSDVDSDTGRFDEPPQRWSPFDATLYHTKKKRRLENMSLPRHHLELGEQNAGGLTQWHPRP